MTRLTALAAITTISADDLLHIVDDPGGTNLDKKMTLANFILSAGVVIQAPATAAKGTIQPSADIVPLTLKGHSGAASPLLELQLNAGTVVGVVSPVGLVTFKPIDAATNTITNVLTIDHNSSSTPTTSFGTGLSFLGKSSTTAAQSMGRLYSRWLDAVHATRLGALTLTAFNVATEVAVAHVSVDASGLPTLTVGYPTPLSGYLMYLYDTSNRSSIRLTAGSMSSSNLTALDVSATYIGTSGNSSGMVLNFSDSGTTSSVITGLFSQYIKNNIAGTTANAYAIEGKIQSTGASAGNVTTANSIVGSALVAGAGNLTTWNAFKVNSPTFTSTGIIPTAYGLNVAALQITGVTTAIAISTQDGLVVFNEAGHASADLRVEGDTDINLLFTQASTDRVGIGTATPATKLHVTIDNAVTNAVTNLLTLNHSSSGTPAAGFGTGLLFAGESDTTLAQSMGSVNVEWATATHASRKARLTLNAYDTAIREGLRVEASGSAPMIGMYGTAAVAQQTITGSRGGNAALADLLTKLALIGIIIDGSSA